VFRTRDDLAGDILVSLSDGDCVFNANDLLYLENVFNRQNDGTADQLDAMTAHQTSQFAPSLRKPGYPDGSDLQYMLAGAFIRPHFSSTEAVVVPYI